ncbi:MAG: heme exporter protein CcmB [Bacteroidetes bacterium]|jgi:heme exporter protein B|nr:heme exporter protein CcmB [Bacteroidota bacterium]
MWLSTVWFLVRKDLLLEWREKNAISAIAMYVLCTCFVVYQVFVSVEPKAWIALYWIVALFAAINAAARAFVQEQGHTKLYYYQLVGPQVMILSKVLFNSALMLLLSLLTTAVFALLLGFPHQGLGMWFTISALGGLGLGISFTMIAAIASKATNSGVLMAILGLPVVIPQLLVLVQVSSKALLVLPFSVIYKDLIGLLAIDAVALAVALVFFPFIWRD